MKKPHHKRQQDWKQTVFSNQHSAPFNPNKLSKFYGVITVGDKNYFTNYECKFRSEAIAIFKEEGRLAGGQLSAFGVLK